ncbi:MAG TPA: hypothetical protein VFI70_00145, partial [Nitrososphaeraceae archaeon]|nr:hypothetical protein [Nitrososphaeraceae archaeon]
SDYSMEHIHRTECILRICAAIHKNTTYDNRALDSAFLRNSCFVAQLCYPSVTAEIYAFIVTNQV